MKVLVGNDWKTTAAGSLSAFIGAVGPLTAYLAAMNSPKAAAFAGALTCAGLIARVWVGMLQNYVQSDPNIPAQTTPAVVTLQTTGPVPTPTPVDAASIK
jgi:hypothetical protein